MPRIPGHAIIASLAVFLASATTGIWATPSLGVPAPPENRARTLARQAYEAMTLHPFRADIVAEALGDLARAHDLDPEEPWIYIAASKAMLIQGYRSGDWNDQRSFDAGSVEQAIVLAREALDLGPNDSGACTNLASLLIVQGQYRDAAALLDRAKGLDAAGFFPRYGEAILWMKQGDLKKAESVLGEAASRARGGLERTLLAQKGLDLARGRGDVAAEEKFLKETIAADPDDANRHGMYADFLMSRSRYGEAVVAWERAARLDPSPHAVAQLTEAKRLRDMPAEETEVTALIDPQLNAVALRARGPAVLPILARLYERSDGARRTTIAYAFYVLGWKSPEAKRVLMRDIHTDNQDLRLQVQWALGRVSNDPDVVEALLANMQNDPNPLFRDKAACALANDQIFLTEDQKVGLYARLIQALRDPKLQVRAIALQALSIHTGQTKGFDPNASEGQREEKAREWERWLQEYRSR